jgi:hypothetical protein
LLPAVADTRLLNISDEARQCRNRHHMWPRDTDREFIKLVVTAPKGSRKPLQSNWIAEVELQLICMGRCGLYVGEDQAITRDGRTVRLGKPHVRQLPGTNFYLKRDEEHGLVGRADRDEVRYAASYGLYYDLLKKVYE